MNTVRNDLSNFNKTVNNFTEKVSNLEEHHDQLSSKMDQIESKLDSIKRMTFKAVENQLEEYKQQMTSELTELQRNTTSEIATLHTSLQSNTHQLTTKLDTLDSINVSLTSHTEHLSHLNGKMDILNASIREDLSCIKEDLSSLNETMNRITDHMEEHDNHGTTEPTMINECLEPNVTQPPNNDSLHTCGGTGDWRRVVYLDMTDLNTTCPSGWELTSHSKRTCGKVGTSSLTCDSIIFPVSGGDYTRVCGRIKGYQYRGTDAFEAYDDDRVTTIDGAYVSGVSLTHGSPRQHIWTFAAGFSEVLTTRDDACPCDATINITIPQFMGGDYFCESGHSSGPNIPNTLFLPDDPLWDGYGCTASSTCCSFNNPPYFNKQLPSPTTDDIEARLCRWESSDDTPIELIELYVQ